MLYENIPFSDKWAAFTLDLEEDHAGLSGGIAYDALPVLEEIVPSLREAGAPLSVFVAGNFLERSGRSPSSLPPADYHSHAYSHLTRKLLGQRPLRRDNILRGLAAFEDFFGRRSLGYRAPCGVLDEMDLSLLAREGVRFDSSYFPGVHVGGLHPERSVRPHRFPDCGLVEIPVSRHPFLPCPFSLSYMNLLGEGLFLGTAKGRAWPRPLVFNFHLHDLVETSTGKGLPLLWRMIYHRRPSPGKAGTVLGEFAESLKRRGYRLVSMEEIFNRLAGPVAAAS
jgi:peptidoglycan/xylan/chitin deacetylase (PgdA/CDA1 family)